MEHREDTFQVKWVDAKAFEETGLKVEEVEKELPSNPCRIPPQRLGWSIPVTSKMSLAPRIGPHDK